MKFRDVSSSDEACPDWMLSEFWQVFGLSLLTCVLRDLLQELSGYSRCLTKLFSVIRDGMFCVRSFQKCSISCATEGFLDNHCANESRDAAMN